MKLTEPMSHYGSQSGLSYDLGREPDLTASSPVYLTLPVTLWLAGRGLFHPISQCNSGAL